MNYWTQLSVEFANQRNYLDELFRVYPCIPEGIREIDDAQWRRVEQAFKARDNQALVEALLEMEHFPIKDPYVAYLRRDPSAIARNPRTVNRLCGRLFELGLDQIYTRCAEPREMNRQIGPMFKRWVFSGALGVPALPQEEFLSSEGDALLEGSDAQLGRFAREHLGYQRDRGPDFVARFHGTFVVGEAKFLTDVGGHQNAQFTDAVSLFSDPVRAEKVAVLDGVLYIPSQNRMHRYLQEHPEHCVMSALVLRDFLYQL